MQSAAATVEAYLAELPEDRREAIEAIRKVILKNLPKGYEEGMLYGMIGYYVPHSIYPDGYHFTPTDPLPFANLASQKTTCPFTGWVFMSTRRRKESLEETIGRQGEGTLNELAATVGADCAWLGGCAWPSAGN